MTQFYTYMWLREDGTPYYVGKGSGRRGFRSQGHNIHCPPFKARIRVQHWQSEEEALQMEKWWISLFGRQDIGTGILRNMTDGGDGQSGLVHSELTKERIREANVGENNHFFGKIHSEQTRNKMSESHKVLRKPEEIKVKLTRSEAQLLSWSTKRKGQPRKPRVKNIPTCHSEGKYQGKGLCTACYLKEYHKKVKGAAA